MLASPILGVALMNALALSLVVARSRVFHTTLYRPMLLNLALSVAPLVVLVGGLAVVVLSRYVVPTPVVVGLLVVVGLVWLLLLPNAGYLITELNLSHRRDEDGVPMWFDVVLVISLAMSGVLNTVLNVFAAQLVWVVQVHGDEAAPLQSLDARLIVVAILVLVSFGMYLGRSVRLNSWDVRHPRSLVGKVVDHLRSPGAVGNAVGFTFLHALFLGIIYLVVVGPVVAGLIALEQSR
ncbi:DUF1361 domain-containing protein [Cellulomonas sp. Leaf334]|uniref:DUF1361 domain-containing protein n=1 Tax=Cellulomonas sp. Leaf334 TaxID=1736339 RepID=UPI0006F2C139|nr:DUF1361 domain-containing protein [Cellulomonas sp. Leaf334]KQR11715.1 hypothetical protein ASF78_10780 [Cellulomonas sp. Leaf334]